ncbi:hypothetical protein [Leptospira interrogans]|uniref:hypothetical protein n=1 Tax=Leptospira interrogans TaxID=173 RepID=UPI00031D4B69|nr:hypothetical protein [Leptospira interrogans]
MVLCNKIAEGIDTRNIGESPFCWVHSDSKILLTCGVGDGSHFKTFDGSHSIIN